MAKSVGAKRGRSKANKGENGAQSLIDALKFISLAQQREGTPQQTHCAIDGGKIIAFNGVFAVGHLIDDDLSACPHTTRLLDALNKCGATLSITHLDTGRLSVKSDKFRALIPCMPFDAMAYIEPDPPCAVIDDRLKTAFGVVAPILQDTSDRAFLTGALLQANSVVATNGFALIEYWHGIDLPPGLIVPKLTLQAIAKTPKKLTRFGYSENSVTFFFEDESFIRSQLIGVQYPNYEQIAFQGQFNPWPLPKDFFAAVKTVQPFADDKTVYFGASNVFVLDAEHQETGSFEVEGLKEGLAFNMDYLTLLEDVFKEVDFDTENGRAYFTAKTADGTFYVRGVLMGIRPRRKV